MTYIETLGSNAVKVKKILAVADTGKKNSALAEISRALIENSDKIIEANQKDLTAAKENGMSVSMQDRLMLNEDRIKGIASAVDELIKLEDPIGKVDNGSVRPNGMRITKIRVPMGVIGMIYESRPNVTADAATLCLKTGNAVILRGGKEAYNSNKCICEIMRDAVEKAGFPKDIIQFVDDNTREVTTELMKCDKYLDLLIPRGGAGLIKAVTKNATVPVIETGTGNCHLYVDDSADIEMAVKSPTMPRPSVPPFATLSKHCLYTKTLQKNFFPLLRKSLTSIM